MNKYDTVFDLIEHPEKYSPEKISILLRDPDAKELYNLFCATKSAMYTNVSPKSTEVEAQWKKFESENYRSTRKLRWLGNSAASIGIIVMSSFAAVAACISITVVFSGKNDVDSKVDTVKVAHAPVIDSPQIVQEPDSINWNDGPVMFENESLENILKTVASHYNVTSIQFNNKATADLHLYYKFDPSLSVYEIVDELNTFEQITIVTDGKNIIVD